MEDLVEQIRSKLNSEYVQYRESLLGLDVVSAVDSAYELVIKKELTFVLEGELLSDLDNETLNHLYECDNLLSWMYEEWLHSDLGIHQELQECIKDSILFGRLPPKSTNYFK